MTRQQGGSILFFVLLFAVLFFVFDTKPKDVRVLDEVTSLNAGSGDLNKVLEAKKSALPKDSLLLINSLESDLLAIAEDSSKAELLKRMSGWWYRKDQYYLAGYYAEKVAEIEKTDNAWAIAATTYTAGSDTGEELQDKLCREKAIKSFENAISIAPQNVAHRVNLALCYADHPPAENPMKGIQMLLELSKESPEDVLVQITLAKLAIKTGQFDKATARLNKLLEKNPDVKSANCLLSEIYTQTGDKEKADLYSKKCK
jgi:tetratricopeptide (TPR) repeat protein